MSAEVPQQIGRYAVSRMLGQGAMGRVFLGRDPQLDRSVAIKTVRSQGLGEQQLEMFVNRFKNEARAAARLHHPSIVAVYDVGEDAEQGHFLVMEYVPGTSLKTVLSSRGPLAPTQAVQLAEQIGKALDSAHAAGVIHRDIKPDNLLVTPEGRYKLADFGVARVPDAQLTREGQFLGTPCYAAPETLSKGDYGPETDRFSFAAVLYEAISGTRAFPGDEAISVAHKVIHDEPPPPSRVSRGGKIPAEVDRVVMDGLSKDPAQRYGSAIDFARALREAYTLAGELGAPDAADSTPDAPIASPASRGSTAWFFGVVAFFLIGGAGVVVWLGSGGPSVVVDAADAGAQPLVDAGARTVVADAGVAVDLGPPDAGAEALDAGPVEVDLGPPVGPSDEALAQMSSMDREEHAKDALDRARAALASGDRAAARAAIEEARRYDPGNPDVLELSGRIAP